jgi:hypothetical protein
VTHPVAARSNDEPALEHHGLEHEMPNRAMGANLAAHGFHPLAELRDAKARRLRAETFDPMNLAARRDEVPTVILARA